MNRYIFLWFLPLNINVKFNNSMASLIQIILFYLRPQTTCLEWQRSIVKSWANRTNDNINERKIELRWNLYIATGIFSLIDAKFYDLHGKTLTSYVYFTCGQRPPVLSDVRSLCPGFAVVQWFATACLERPSRRAGACQDGRSRHVSPWGTVITVGLMSRTLPVFIPVYHKIIL